MQINLRTGKGYINATNRNYANSIHLQIEPLKCELTEEVKTQIQSYLWNNAGKAGNINNVVFFENKELFTI